ncbi:biotin/lipoyl-containing protein, partial [Kribbella jejuensis]
MGIQQFRLPDVGEGLVEAEIVSWKVKPGDTVKLNDTIVEIETAKSLVELPVPFAGVITDLLVPEGETVPVGTPIISVQTESAGEEPLADDMVPSIPEPEESGGRTAVLVGYGPKTTESKRRQRKPAPTPGGTPTPVGTPGTAGAALAATPAPPPAPATAAPAAFA